MKRVKISPSALSGTIAIPPSKSHTMRALLFASLAKGKSLVHNYLQSPDTEAMIEAMRLFGANIVKREKSLEIIGVNGRPKAPDNIIDAKNSGQVLRFCAALSALLPTYTVITGDYSVRYRRPVQPLLSAINQLGGQALSTRGNDLAPIIIRGPIHADTATLSGIDSQPVSALLMTAPLLSGTTHLHVTNPGEKPWIDLTLAWLKRFGVSVKAENYEHYTIEGPFSFNGFETTLPGDFSSAAFPLIAALITHSTVMLENIDFDDIQGDKELFFLLEKLGAHFEYHPPQKRLTVQGGRVIDGGVIDANAIIDAVPLLAVLGCFSKDKITLINAAIARKKESDRLSAITQELRKMGAKIEEREDGLIIEPSKLHGASLFSHRDHRIAMALSVAALNASSDSTLEEIDCINKSFPDFIPSFQKLGARYEVIDE